MVLLNVARVVAAAVLESAVDGADADVLVEEEEGGEEEGGDGGEEAVEGGNDGEIDEEGSCVGQLERVRDWESWDVELLELAEVVGEGETENGNDGREVRQKRANAGREVRRLAQADEGVGKEEGAQRQGRLDEGESEVFGREHEVRAEGFQSLVDEISAEQRVEHVVREPRAVLNQAMSDASVRKGRRGRRGGGGVCAGAT